MYYFEKPLWFSLTFHSLHLVLYRIAGYDSVSSYSKDYFRKKSKVFTVLVLMSGGSFRALTFMNSNLFGLNILSAGLSKLQLQRFQSHHVIATVLTENVPQIMLQYWFMFQVFTGFS